ncbi:cell division protein CrgA [Herbiconiux daphne]|uniref:Cell division protein CrgA n=1 Tax=Herbiconiux daphne TaxID=2970914 RepID=A0ABT2GWZ5_9MICO|nr:cell division protein CrgA [Herbiconiux daphne]MCS5732448.1 cell division protein CrgA [Herbiconiux daphne]
MSPTSAPHSRALLTAGIIATAIGALCLLAGGTWIVVYVVTGGAAPVRHLESANLLIGGGAVLMGLVLGSTGVAMTRLSRRGE